MNKKALLIGIGVLSVGAIGYYFWMNRKKDSSNDVVKKNDPSRSVAPPKFDPTKPIDETTKNKTVNIGVVERGQIRFNRDIRGGGIYEK